jgi:rhodanese-related sulfurtransferase
VAKITTDQAEALLDVGVPFIDVRTEEEFQDGHVPGAINIPISFASPGGMKPNPDFVAVVAAHFAKTDRLIVACKAGGRSARAAAELEGAGFVQVLDMSAGFHGSKDAFGAALPGWQAEGREVELTAEEAQTYAAKSAHLKK